MGAVSYLEDIEERRYEGLAYRSFPSLSVAGASSERRRIPNIRRRKIRPFVYTKRVLSESERQDWLFVAKTVTPLRKP
jgi:hypothetical protein